MTKPKTVQQWLKEKDLPTELGRVLVPEEEWKHDWFDNLHVPRCAKCQCDSGSVKSQKPCPNPDPITIDQNTAKYWQGKCDVEKFYRALWLVYEEECEHMPDEHEGHWVSHLFERWVVYVVDARKWLIAAAMAAERKKE